MKKLASLALTIIMVLALAVPAFATGNNTITINDSVSGHEYTAYQIFSGNYSDGKLTNIDWGSGVDGPALLDALKADGTIGSIFTTFTTAQQVADKLATDSSIASLFASVAGKHLATAADTSSEGKGSYTISGLDDGYYLVKQTGNVGAGEVYSLYMVKVVGGTNVNVNPKIDSVPTPDKTIGEAATSGSYSIGDTINFTIKTNLPSALSYGEYESYYLSFIDTMSEGLTYNNDAAVTVNYQDATSSFDIDYNAISGKLTITCEDVKRVCTFGGAEVEVTYSATLNEKAVIGGTGNENTVYLEYSNDPYSGSHGTSVEDETYVYTFKMDGTKVDGKTDAPLENAYFVLQRTSDSKYAEVDDNGMVTGWVDAKPDPGNIVSDADGHFTLTGLATGTYNLIETAAPQGYNLLATPIVINVSADLSNHSDVKLTVTMDGAPITADPGTGVFEPKVANLSGAMLPSTGGIGTTIFYTMGGLLAVGAAVLLVTKKRVHDAEA